MTSLAALQLAVDELDDGLVELLARRFQITREIGQVKKVSGSAPVDPNRLRFQCDRFVAEAARRGLAAGMAQQLIAVIVAQVLVERVAFADDAAGGPRAIGVEGATKDA